MYSQYFGLTKHPFELTPDPAFLFLTRQHREGLAGLAYSILERKGFLLLTGAAGLGKTTLLAWLLEKLAPGRVSSSVILNPLLTPAEFFELVLLNFGVADVPDSKARRLQLLRKLLDEGTAEGRIHVLIVDEAHKLDAELLEEVRLLGNFQSTGSALLQILLIGQNELDETLCRPGLWQFKQRIAVRLELQPLVPAEVQLYIEHRWRTAGGSLPVPLAADAVAAVTDLSGGTPRLVNSLCDNALILAFAEDQRQVTAAHIRTAAADLRLTPLPPAAALPPLPMLRMIGAHTEPKPHKPSPKSRWAAKLGLA
jgi:general secretion pathway protein A